MKNKIFIKLLDYIYKDKEVFDASVKADNTLGINISSNDIVDYLDYSFEDLTKTDQIRGNVIITEGDVESVLRAIKDLENYKGDYILFINKDNMAIISYFIKRANDIYKELNIPVKILIDYSDNYNKYINELVTIIGKETFINTVSKDFKNSNLVIV